jgi:hypothetical protein
MMGACLTPGRILPAQRRLRAILIDPVEACEGSIATFGRGLEAAIWNVWRIEAAAFPLIDRSFGPGASVLGNSVLACFIAAPEVKCAETVAVDPWPRVTARFTLIDNQEPLPVEVRYRDRIGISDGRKSGIGLSVRRVLEPI